MLALGLHPFASVQEVLIAEVVVRLAPGASKAELVWGNSIGDHAQVVIREDILLDASGDCYGKHLDKFEVVPRRLRPHFNFLQLGS